jgi:hypothetical protein
MKPLIPILVCCAASLISLAQPQPPVNPDAAIQQEFQKRVTDYLKLRKTIEGQMPRLKPTASVEKIEHHEKEFTHEIREARRSARQGDIFSPEISSEFRRLIALAMQGPNAGRVEKSLRSGEPEVRARVRVVVNHKYPPSVPLQSTPPTLLVNLPKLPPELEYRVVGHYLVLRDSKANLILDYIPNAIP